MQAERAHQVQDRGVVLLPSSWDFGERTVGYEPIAPVCFIIRNTGSLPISNLSVSIDERDMAKYWLCLAHTAEALGCTGDKDSETIFYVYPRDGLGCGTHTANLHIRADGIEPLQVPLSFTVCPQKSLSPSSDLFADPATL